MHVLIRAAMFTGLVGSLLLPGALAFAQVNVTGRWTSKYGTGSQWDDQAVHMILTRGYSNYHSQLLYYDSNHVSGPGFHGGIWGWTAGSTTGNQDCTSYPSSHFTDLTPGNDPPHNIFCTGHSALADGKILITGGTEGGEIGVATSALFTPSTRTGQATGNMGQRRWYPTTTTLPDGSALVSSGSTFIDLQTFGGKSNLSTGALAPDSVQRLGLGVVGEWIPPGKGLSTNWPVARDGHSASWNAGYSQWTIFGGRQDDGSPRQDAWFIYRSSEPDLDDEYSAVQGAGGSVAKPAARFRHSSIVFQDTLLLVFGGKTASAVQNDLWILRKTNMNPAEYSWEQLTASGGPAARQGHTAVYDPINKRMLVFGGAGASDVPIDSTLHALSLTGTPAWSTMTVDGTPPPSRHGHLFVFDPSTRNTTNNAAPNSNYKKRFLVFGGQERGGLSNGLWILWIPDSTSSANYRWEQVSVGATAPSARYRLAGDVDPGNDRLVLSGGDTGGTASAESWSVSIDSLAHDVESWETFPSHPQRAMTGHTGVAKYLNWSRKQEVYSPSTGAWSFIGSQKRQDLYPFHFVAPGTDSVRVFFAGPTDTTRYLVRNGTSSYWRPFPANPTPGYRSGSAVMFRPGEVMRCGSRDTDAQGSLAVATTQRINLTASPLPSSWTTTSDMGLGRVNHNLVILPSGDVLATGGTNWVRNSENRDPIFTPSIWSVGSSTWTPLTGSSALAADSTIRGYHSNAILLPDGRVLAASGSGSSQAGIDSRKATMFCPPYLFNSGGGLRTRMSITPTDNVPYNTEFLVCVEANANLPSSVVLIRPAASTHGFNQDQRYIPLSFQAECDYNQILVTSPLNSSVAPPGDYLLFVNRSNYAPAVGKWIRIGAGLTPEEPTCTAGCEGGGEGAVITFSGDGEGAMTNTLASQSEDDTPIKFAGGASSGHATLTVEQRAGSETQVDDLEAWSVDHPSHLESFASSTTSYAGTLEEPAGVWTDRLGDVASTALGRFGMIQQVDEEDTLYVDFAGAAEEFRPFVVRSRRSSRDLPPVEADPMVTVQVLDPEGTWTAVARFEPRLEFTEVTFDFTAERVRLFSELPFQLKSLGRIDVENSPESSARVSLSTKGQGPVTSAEGAGARPGARRLLANEEISLDLSELPVAAGMSRTWFVRAKSRTTNLRAGAGVREADPVATGPTFVYSLGAARPNPSLGSTSIAYSLATAGPVSIRIYDASGRRVRTLVHGDSPAGPGVVVWDGRDERGARLGGGVYFYRMESQGWASRKKVVLLAGGE